MSSQLRALLGTVFGPHCYLRKEEQDIIKGILLPAAFFFLGVALAPVLLRFPAVEACPALFLRGGMLSVVYLVRKRNMRCGEFWFGVLC